MSEFDAGQIAGPGLIAGIEAATPACGVALADTKGRLRAQSWREGNRPASPILLNELERMLRELEAGPAQLRAIAVTLGPGAFTGLRVGLALAKTLAQALQIPLYGYSTLQMLARRWPGEGVAAALLDARRGEVYAGLYVNGPEGMRALLDDFVAPLGQAAERMRAAVASSEYAGASIHCLGGGAEKFWPEWQQALPGGVLAPTELCSPAAEAVALAGAAALRAGESGINPLLAEPIYLRASDAAVRNPGGVRAGVGAGSGA